MGMSRAVAERAVARAYEEALAPIDVGEPGGVILVSSRGEQLACASRGLASLDSREALSVHTALDAGSVAKVVVGLAVAILEEEGVLSPAARLRDVLPEFPAYGDPLRLEHLLHHESGLRNYFSMLYYMAGWHPRLSPSPDEVFETLCRAGSLAFEPGSRYQYCDSNYFLLARIVERVTGERFGAFARSRILDPLGMDCTCISDAPARATESALAPPSPPARGEGYVRYAIDLKSPFELRPPGPPCTSFQPVRLNYGHVGAEGLYASACDLARLAEHILSPTLVSPETMRDRIVRAPRMRNDGLGYGYGVNVGTYRGRRFVGHDGQIWGYSASLAVFPDDGFDVVALTNRDDLGAWNLRDAVLGALGIGDRAAKPPARRTAPTVRPWRHLLGAYLDPRAAGCYAEIVDRGGGPAMATSGGRIVDLDWIDSATLGGVADGLTIAVISGASERPALEIRRKDGSVSRLEPFIVARGCDAFREYEGDYRCEELATTFAVLATEEGIRLTNRDPRRPSMDLDYTPTIRDHFWSRDPYVELIELRFVRDGDIIRSFVYRGGHEDLHFFRKGAV